jgi:hypothetical protein
LYFWDYLNISNHLLNALLGCFPWCTYWLILLVGINIGGQDDQPELLLNNTWDDWVVTSGITLWLLRWCNIIFYYMSIVFLAHFDSFVVHIFVNERINILSVLRSCSASAAVWIFTEQRDYFALFPILSQLQSLEKEVVSSLSLASEDYYLPDFIQFFSWSCEPLSPAYAHTSLHRCVTLM